MSTCVGPCASGDLSSAFHQSKTLNISRLSGISVDPVISEGYDTLQDMTEKKLQTRLIGYARVSTGGQTLAAQLDQLRAAGCSPIYRETVTGARADRRQLLKLLKAVGPGDVVTVTRIDRLARSTFGLFAIAKRTVDAKAQFRSLAEPWADRRNSRCSSRRKDGDGGRKGPGSRNLPRATMSGGRRFRGWQRPDLRSCAGR